MIAPRWAQKQSRLKVISHIFWSLRGPYTEDNGIPRGDIEGYIKASYGFERHKNDFYDHFEAISWLH